MNSYYLTFGQRYRREPHPSGLAVHPDGYVEIIASSYDEARAIAINNFNLEWSGLYRTNNVPGSRFPKGRLFLVLPDGIDP